MVTTPAAAPLLANHPAVQRVIAYDKQGSERGPGPLWRLAATVRAADRDAVAYCAQGSVRSGALALLARYRHRIGFDTSAGRLLYTRRVAYHASQHHAERLLRLAVGETASIDASDLRPSLFPSQADRTAVDELLALHGASREPIIALAPGSIWGTKRWPGFAELADTLSGRARIAIIGGSSDRHLADAILARVPGAIDATGRLGLLGSAELIGRALLLVTNDSLPQHLASAMGTRTLTIFGPTVPGFGFGPLAPGSLALGHEGLPCRPCHPHGPPTCPLGHHACMRDLPATVVAARALEATAA